MPRKSKVKGQNTDADLVPEPIGSAPTKKIEIPRLQLSRFNVRESLLILAIVTWVVVSFLPALTNDFVDYDDDANFINNLSYRGLSPTHLKWMFTTFLYGPYQPLSWLTLGFDYVIWGMNPMGYHLTNLVLHSANAVLFYYLLVAIFRTRTTLTHSMSSLGIRVACTVGALFFAIHPLRVESVAWATERRDVLSGLFFLLTILTYLRMAESGLSSRSKWYLLSCFFFLLALMSKATAMTLPVALLILDIYPLKRLALGRQRMASLKQLALEKIPFFILSGIFAGLAIYGQRQVGAAVSFSKLPLADRLLQCAYGLCFYIEKTVIPAHLYPIYLLYSSSKVGDPKFLTCAFLVLTFTTLVLVMRQRWPWLIAAWFCYGVIASPILGLAQSGSQIAADRYTYLACMPFAMLVAAALAKAWKNAEDENSPRSLIQLTVFALLILGTLAYLTFQQTKVWQDSMTLWEYVLKEDPTNHVGYSNRGVIRQRCKDFDGALADYEAGIRLNPEFGTLYYNRANIRRAKDIKGALADYELALRLDPSLIQAHKERVQLLEQQGLTREAIADYDLLIKENPSSAENYHKRGVLRQNQGDVEGAISDYERAIQLNPSLVMGYVNLGGALQLKGDLKGALAQYEKAIQMDPKLPDPYFNRGILKEANGDVTGSLQDYDTAIKLNPRFTKAYNNRGNIRKNKGDLQGALSDYDTALQFDPKDVFSYLNRGLVWQQQGNLKSALEDFSKALELAPVNAPYRPQVEQLIAQIHSKGK